MDVTREYISHILEPGEMLLSFQTGFNFVDAAVIYAIKCIVLPLVLTVLPPVLTVLPPVLAVLPLVLTVLPPVLAVPCPGVWSSEFDPRESGPEQVRLTVSMACDAPQK